MLGNDVPTPRLAWVLAADGTGAQQSTLVLQANILGDWREEVIWRTTDNQPPHASFASP